MHLLLFCIGLLKYIIFLLIFGSKLILLLKFRKQVQNVKTSILYSFILYRIIAYYFVLSSIIPLILWIMVKIRNNNIVNLNNQATFHLSTIHNHNNKTYIFTH